MVGSCAERKALEDLGETSCDTKRGRAAVNDDAHLYGICLHSLTAVTSRSASAATERGNEGRSIIPADITARSTITCRNRDRLVRNMSCDGVDC